MIAVADSGGGKSDRMIRFMQLPTREVQDLHVQLDWLMQRGAYDRASRVADRILDVMYPTWVPR